MEHQDSDFKWKIAYERLMSKVMNTLDLLEDSVLNGEISSTTLYKILKKLIQDEKIRTVTQLQPQSKRQTSFSAHNDISSSFTPVTVNTENRWEKVKENLNASSDLETGIIIMEIENGEKLDADAGKMEKDAKSQIEGTTLNFQGEETAKRSQSTHIHTDTISDTPFEPTQPQHEGKHEQQKKETQSKPQLNKKLYKCPEPNCEYSARISSTLTVHRQNHERKRKTGKEVAEHPKFQCPHCEYSGKTKYMLSSHKKPHSLEKPFACSFEQCEFRCKFTASLSHHLKTHGEEIQYKCELCPFRGKTRSDVKQHIRNLHPDPKSLTFKCKERRCVFESRTKQGLNNHFLTHSEQKKYACSFPGCDYLSLVKQNVKLHEYNIHSEEKKEKCSLCDYTCKFKSVLTVHMRTHTKEEPYKCKETNCAYRAKQAKVLKHHQKKYHPQI